MRRGVKLRSPVAQHRAERVLHQCRHLMRVISPLRPLDNAARRCQTAKCDQSSGSAMLAENPARIRCRTSPSSRATFMRATVPARGYPCASLCIVPNFHRRFHDAAHHATKMIELTCVFVCFCENRFRTPLLRANALPARTTRQRSDRRRHDRPSTKIA